jgi:hypothetical protein
MLLLNADENGTIRFQRFNEREEEFTGKSKVRPKSWERFAGRRQKRSVDRTTGRARAQRRASGPQKDVVRGIETRDDVSVLVARR